MLDPKAILLIQLPTPSLTPAESCGNLPLGPADLILHTQKEVPDSKYRPILLDQDFLNRAGDAALIKQIGELNPSIVGFSCMVWNSERTLHIARQLLVVNPELRIWLGGPEIAADSFIVTDSTAPFEVAAAGEGENAFAMLMQSDSPESITGLFKPGGDRTKGMQRPGLLGDLSSIHDPFLTNLVVMERHRTVYAELWRGCKYRCGFCCYHQGRHAQAAARPMSNLVELLGWSRDHEVRDLYILDPSLEQRSDLDTLLEVLATHNRDPLIPIFVELRAEAVDEILAEKLYLGGIRKVEVGLQTLTTRALHKQGRRLQLDRFYAGVEFLVERDIEVKIDLMFGLPEDSPDQFDSTLHRLAERGLTDRYQVFRTQALPGTRLRNYAERWGIAFDYRPPYFIRSTPSWSTESIDNIPERASEILDLSMDPDETPYIKQPEWKESAWSDYWYPNVKVCFQKAYSLDENSARSAIRQERFTEVGNYFGLWLACNKPLEHLSLMNQAVRTLITQNPYSTLWFGLQIPPETPLDVIDRLSMTIEGLPEPRYLSESAYQRPVAFKPQRRLLVMLDVSAQSRINQDWLAELRTLGEIIWLSGYLNLLEAVHCFNESDIAQDYLYCQLPDLDSALLNQWFEVLAEEVNEPERLLFPALESQWAYQRFLVGESDW